MPSQLYSHLELPPPSAQRAASTAGGVASVRARGTVRTRAGARNNGNNKEANNDPSNDPVATAISTAAHAASLRKKHNGRHASSHIPSSSSSRMISSSSSTPPAPLSAPNLSNPKASSAHASSSAAPPAPRSFFDPWNTSLTGHQRAENRLSGSTSWRESRNLKLSEQYHGGLSGGRRVAVTVGAGSEGFGHDGRKVSGGWERGASGLRTGRQKSLLEIWGASKASSTTTTSSIPKVEVHSQDQGNLEGAAGAASKLKEEPHLEDLATDENDPNPEAFSKPHKQIFHGLCFYLNGSTAPLVSDHKLKYLLAERGGNLSIALGRRSVTHVILGTINGQGGCGGGLAASKMQKEITRLRGKSIKFVNAEW